MADTTSNISPIFSSLPQELVLKILEEGLYHKEPGKKNTWSWKILALNKMTRACLAPRYYRSKFFGFRYPSQLVTKSLEKATDICLKNAREFVLGVDLAILENPLDFERYVADVEMTTKMLDSHEKLLSFNTLVFLTYFHSRPSRENGFPVSSWTSYADHGMWGGDMTAAKFWRGYFDTDLDLFCDSATLLRNLGLALPRFQIRDIYDLSFEREHGGRLQMSFESKPILTYRVPSDTVQVKPNTMLIAIDRKGQPPLDIDCAPVIKA